MTAFRSPLIEKACAEFSEGRLWRADSAARQHIREAGPDPEALALRARIEAALDLTGWRDRPAPPDIGKHLLIPACGAGFWADMAHVLAGMLLAEITGRAPIVHWGATCRFRGPNLGDADAFAQFFDPIAPTDLAVLEGEADRWPQAWPLDAPRGLTPPAQGCDPLTLLARRERVLIAPKYLPLPDLIDWVPRGHRLFGLNATEVFRLLITERLRVKDAILAEAAATLADPLGGGPFFSAHLRGTDKKNEVPNNDALITAYLLWTDRMFAQADHPLFLATDDQRFADVFRDRYGPRVVLTGATRRSDGIGVHADPGDAGYRLGAELLVDCLVAAEGVRFAGNGLSGPSCAIALMRRQPPASCTLFAESLWLREDMAQLLL